MARLAALKPRLSGLDKRLSDAEPLPVERDRSNAPWRKWYKIARWRKLRQVILLGAHYTCRMCGKLEGDTSKLVCDHIIPHRGDERLFWDESNLQCVCKECHDTHKQKQEQSTLHQRGVWY